MSSPKFTILLPTSIDRGLLLPYSVGSVQNQSIQDFELLIIGDGVNDFTRGVIQDLQSKDSRIHFFDFPKHPRRGEENRHEVLKQAKGKYVAYLCDRDLMLPNHLETLGHYLQDSNFASTLNYSIVNNNLRLGFKNIEDPRSASWVLSCVGHSLSFYMKLPFGWRTTPKGIYTDEYMWSQFLDHPECKPFSGLEPTILWFKRGDHPGLSSEERMKELSGWFEIIKNTGKLAIKKDKAFFVALSALELQRKNHFILLKGKSIKGIWGILYRKLKTAYSFNK